MVIFRCLPKEAEAAIGTEKFEKLIDIMGGDYGYTLGYRDELVI